MRQLLHPKALHCYQEFVPCIHLNLRKSANRAPLKR